MASDYNLQTITAWFNGDPYHAAPLSLGLVLSSLHNGTITYYHHPLPMPPQLQVPTTSTKTGFLTIMCLVAVAENPELSRTAIRFHYGDYNRHNYRILYHLLHPGTCFWEQAPSIRFWCQRFSVLDGNVLVRHNYLLDNILHYNYHGTHNSVRRVNNGRRIR